MKKYKEAENRETVQDKSSSFHTRISHGSCVVLTGSSHHYITTSNQLSKELVQRMSSRMMSPPPSQKDLAFSAKASVVAPSHVFGRVMKTGSILLEFLMFPRTTPLPPA